MKAVSAHVASKQASKQQQGRVRSTSRKVSKLGACCQMASEGKDVQSLLIPSGPKGIRGGSDPTAMFLEDLCRPCAHITEALHWVLLRSIPAHSSSKHRNKV